MNDVLKSTVLPFVCITLMGCASKNYDFSAVPGGPSRVAQLVGDLDQRTNPEGGEPDELYDISLFPLVHSRLHVFAEADEDDSPVEYVEADIDAFLPLFGFVSGTVSQYDEHQDLLSHHEFESSLWGAFRNHREIVVTHAGSREQTHHTFLWLFTWHEDERWQPTEAFDPRDAVTN